MAGVGLGGSIIPQLANALIELIGWRGAYASLALLTFLIAFPAVALWICKPRPGEGEQHAIFSAVGLPGGHRTRSGSFVAFLGSGSGILPGGGRH
jgi:hypothetical protein